MEIKEHKEKVKQLLASPRNIVITTHHGPDGDAIGSSLGLYNMLEQLGHKVSVITPNEYPDFLHWMPGDETIIEYERNPEIAKQKAQESDIVFCLDYNNTSRLKSLGEVIENTNATKILIDHHLFPDDFCDYTLSEITASSTAQLVYEFFELMGWDEKLNKNIADCLYAGIMTDTLSFKIGTTSARTHEIAAKLIGAGVEGHKIQQQVFDNNSESRLRLLGHSLLNKMKVFSAHGAAYISLNQNELRQYSYKAGDTEGLVNYPLSIQGIVFSTLITEKEDEIRLSFRSKGDFSVNELAREHFEGGGHKNAAGGVSKLTLPETEEKLINVIQQYGEQKAV